MDLDNRLISKTSVLNRGREITSGLDFAVKNQTYMQNMSAGFINIPNLIQPSNIATAQGSVVAGADVVVTFTLTPNVNTLGTAYKNFADPYVAIYEGTAAVAANQIWPYTGANITAGKFPCQGGNDYRTYTRTNSVFTVNIENTTGTTANIYAEGDWKILSYSRVEQQ